MKKMRTQYSIEPVRDIIQEEDSAPSLSDESLQIDKGPSKLLKAPNADVQFDSEGRASEPDADQNTSTVTIGT